VRDDRADPIRLSIATICITWIPLLVLSLLEAARGRPVPLIRDLSVHARLLVAVPLLFVAERVIDKESRDAVDQLVGDRLIARESIGRFQSLVLRIARARESIWPEVALIGLVLAFSASVVFKKGTTFSTLSPTAGAAELYFFMVVLPIFQFIMFRVLWHWILWLVVPLRLAFLPLELEPLHPDRAGGLEVVCRPTYGFGFLLCAGSVVLSAEWGNRILFQGAALDQFRSSFAVYVLLGLFVAVGPLLLFAPQLYRSRMTGKGLLGSFALDHSREFEARWLVRTQGELDANGARPRYGGYPTAGPEIVWMGNLGFTNELVEKMRWFPFENRLILILVVLMVLPVLPLALSTRSIGDLTRGLGHLVLGGAE
jgi:hypothetical protein